MELYKFTNGDNVTRFTNARRDFVDKHDVKWETVFIERDFINIETFSGDLTINVNIQNKIVQDYKIFNSNSFVKVEIYSINDMFVDNDYTRNYSLYKVGNEDLTENLITKIYNGSINSVEFDIDKGISKIKCKVFSGKFNSKMPNQYFSPNCPYNIYGKECGLNRDLFKTEVAKSSGSFNTIRNRYSNPDLGNVINIDKHKRGIFKVTDINNKEEFSFISKVNKVDNYLVLLYPIITKDINILKVEIFQGCDKTLEDCKYKQNLDNYGGFPMIPTNNPVKRL